jgi:hypothetical protein
MEEYTQPGETYATEGNLSAVLHEARFAGGIAASGQRAGFGGNLFTRDACRMMRDTMDKYPSMTRELLSTLPQMQGVDYNEATNEFPDAMPHQTFRQITSGRRLPDKLVESAEFWTTKWGVELQHNDIDGKWFTIYNSSDGPLLYLITLAEFSRLPEGKDVLKDEFIHKPTGQVRTVGEAGRRCVDAIMRSMKESEDKWSGLYIVPNTNPKQTSPSGVMRDGFDSYYYPDGEKGRPVDFGAMAYIDNQALAYEALMVAATDLYPDDADAPQWRAKAEEIRTRTLESFWMEGAHYFAAAVDGRGQTVCLESNAAAEMLNGPFLKRDDGPEYVKAILRWLYSPQVMTPIGPRMISRKFDDYEGVYYAYQGTGTVWPHVNGIIAKGLRKHWGLYRPSHDIGMKRTVGHLNRAGEAVEMAFVHRKSNEPVYNPYQSEIRAAGALAIAAAELGQEDQGWAASAGLRELWDWKAGIPEERPGSWQRALARQIMDVAVEIPPADLGLPAQSFFVDLEKGREYKEQRAKDMGLAS